MKQQVTKNESTLKSKVNKNEHDNLQSQVTYLRDALQAHEAELANVQRIKQQVLRIAYFLTTFR